MADKDVIDELKGRRSQRKATGTKTKTRSEESANEAGENLNDRLSQVSDRLAENMKKQIVTKAIAKTLTDIENGDFGDLADAMLQSLDDGINAPLEAEYRVLEGWKDSPKSLMPYVDVSNG